MAEFELGQKVRYRNTLHRITKYGHDYSVPAQKVWEPYPWADGLPGANAELAGEGIVTGLRTLSNGTADYTGDAITYKSTGSFTAVVITHHLRRRPVLVRPEDVTAMPDA